MSNRCSFCGTHDFPTKLPRTVVAGDNCENWMTFCEECEDAPIENVATGEKITISELYYRASDVSIN